MTANRGLVALVALAVLVWGVAFAGGATIAVLTANATVTTTFETPDELRQIDESAGEGFAVAAVANGTAEVNGTAPTATAAGPGENVSAPPDGNTSSPTDGNTSSPTDGNTSSPTDGNTSSPSETAPSTDGNASAPDGDGASVPGDGNASSPPETASTAGGNASSPADGGESSPNETGTEPSETGERSTDESSGAENSTAVSAPVNAFDADPRPASDRSNGT
ncbi:MULTISPECIES: hypothetical protein [unclassified Halorubrum]|uniref:hypothetical protein n=1 Tax=unclassified Halorubrum TaxID=2642239 RepID=UPI0010F57865|nr:MULTISPECIES: hypothetical protein [unclassified Halorubrum]TKX42143.1 hypothetical protein EXE50_15450 [Halorubrum sp. ARQ200]TKX49334.1 hypothetical protein EXE49_12435 [Halorubrum sp. ASP121]